VIENAAEAGYALTLAPQAKAALKGLCVEDLSNGGRGIRNKIEAHLINPLARALFETDGQGTFLIETLEPGPVTTLRLKALP
jgi:ATP-dependent Clp protease ATP-binding subunit ClpA